jgi:hypothetical protein
MRSTDPSVKIFEERLTQYVIPKNYNLAYPLDHFKVRYQRLLTTLHSSLQDTILSLISPYYNVFYILRGKRIPINAKLVIGRQLLSDSHTLTVDNYETSLETNETIDYINNSDFEDVMERFTEHLESTGFFKTGLFDLELELDFYIEKLNRHY